jgi:hypothetical protein
VEQRIREWLEQSESPELGAVFILNRDSAQLLVDQIAANRQWTAEQVAANWQRVLVATTSAGSRTDSESVRKLDRLRLDFEHLERWARGESQGNAFAVQLTYYAHARLEEWDRPAEEWEP